MKNNFNNKKSEELIKNIEKAIDRRMKKDDKAIHKHPIIFGFLGTVGLVAVFVGLEEMIRQIPYLYNNPYVLTLLGVVILFFTGALYKILE